MLPETDGLERSWTRSGRSRHTLLSQVMEDRLDTSFVSFVDFEVRISLFNDINNPFTKGVECALEYCTILKAAIESVGNV